MPKITEDMTIEDGMVLGYVRTGMMGSKCDFYICSVEEWEQLSKSEAETVARDALFESGVMEWGY